MQFQSQIGQNFFPLLLSVHMRRIILLVPPQLGFDPGYQFQWQKRLGDIIIRPQRKSGDLIHLPVPGRQHNNRIGMRCPDPPAQ